MRVTAQWIILGWLILFVNRKECSQTTFPKQTHTLEFQVPKFWHSISSDTELLDDELEEEIEQTTIHQEPSPFFEEDQTQVNETTQLGSDVYLHCRVQNLGEKIVSWVRRKGDQLHLITFGDSLYSSDSRYSLKFKPPNDWQLHVQYANERDEGQFECQINTSPTLVFIVYLIVVVPRVEIVDERGLTTPDKFYKTGSTIELKCVVSKVPQPTSYVTWKHGLRMLNYDTSRGGISVKTDMLPSGAMSRLYIANANRHDSGNYSCALGDIAQATVMVHVLIGENPALMQTSTCVLLTPATILVTLSVYISTALHR
ncbi:CLUMA_CG011402, isoform A [Clunio marinus]|uniref:CLUMA_CG011402, isoform A n=1 Tax=Clunio marinus TaxID=568069 RepID=A0A1J1IHV1_9DIPT|nr:CLUMA_CG011402, isoform A [Clunio marinus]